MRVCAHVARPWVVAVPHRDEDVGRVAFEHVDVGDAAAVRMVPLKPQVGVVGQVQVAVAVPQHHDVAPRAAARDVDGEVGQQLPVKKVEPFLKVCVCVGRVRGQCVGGGDRCVYVGERGRRGGRGGKRGVRR